MYRQLIKTTLDANKMILLFSLAVNVFFFVLMGSRGAGIFSFMGPSILSFWILLTVLASVDGQEKRTRFCIQLPVTTTEVFFAGWFVVLSWLALHVVAWILYGLLFSNEFTAIHIGELVVSGLGAALIVLIISIGIYLGNYKPAFVQWLYIFSMVLLIAGAIYFDIWIGIIGDGEGFRLYPFALLENLGMELFLSSLLLAVLLASNYLVFQYSDNYLD